MNWQDSIRRAGRSLKNSKGRTILTALAIAVGAFTLTLSIAAGEGARQYADKLISTNVDPRSVFVSKDETVFGGSAPGAGGLREYSEGSTQYAGATFKSLTENDIDKLKQSSKVDKVSPMYLVSAEYIQFEGDKRKFTSDISAYDSSVRSDVAAGEFPPLGKQIEENSAIIPESYVDKLKGQTPASMVGKTVTLHLEKPRSQPSDTEIQKVLSSSGPDGLEKAFAPETKDVSLRIVAVSAKSNTSISTISGVFISEDKARELSEYLTKGTDRYQKYIAATVAVKEGVDPESAKKEIEKNGIVARTAEDLQQLLFTIVNILQGIVIGFGVIALIASVFGIINTQYISVLERTREIGLMKALGMRGRHVSRLFQLEAAWIGMLGGTLGALLAWCIGSLLNPWISEQISLGDNSLLIFQPAPIIVLIIVLMLIAMLAGWFPARKAAKLDPIEALRTE